MVKLGELCVIMQVCFITVGKWLCGVTFLAHLSVIASRCSICECNFTRNISSCGSSDLSACLTPIWPGVITQGIPHVVAWMGVCH